MRTTPLLLLALLAACPESAPTAAPVDPTYRLDTDRFAVSVGMSGDDLRAKYQALAKECMQTEARIFDFHKRLGRKTYDIKGALDAIPALCKHAIETGREL